MELHSPIYLLFLVACVAIMTVVKNRSGRMLLFLGLSYGAYLSWSVTLLLLLVIVSLINFLMFRLLGRFHQTWLIWLGVLVNLLILLSVRSLGTYMELVVISGVLVPIGISFYTLQGMGCLIDRYRGYGANPSLLEFLVFMALWPVVLAGPICRLSEMLPQFRQEYIQKINWDGVRRIILGLFMKVVLADLLAQGPFGRGVNSGFDEIQFWSSTDVIILAFGYGFQLYFDFAGYSHIAIGSALLVGIQLRENFRTPFESSSPSEFWSRWHMSLSSWIRDYVFFPLATTWRGLGRHSLIVLGTMCVFGVWHGMATTFLIWGFYHGFLLIIQRFTERYSLLFFNVPSIVRWAVTFIFINLGWIFFRCDSLKQALQMYKSLFSIWNPSSLEPSFQTIVLFMISANMFLFLLRARVQKWKKRSESQPFYQLLLPAGLAAVLLLTLAWGKSESPFVYVQF